MANPTAYHKLSGVKRTLVAKRRFNSLMSMPRTLTIEEAASRLGLKVSSTKGLLYAHTGSTCWPPAEGDSHA